MVAGSSAALAQANYPLQPTMELRDSDGNVVSAARSACPKDGIAVFSSGWKADTDVDGTFHSDPISLGAHRTDAEGKTQFMFHLSDVPDGLHTVRLQGIGADGEPRTVESVVNCDCDNPPVTTTTTLPTNNGSTTTTTVLGGGGGGTGGGNGGGSGGLGSQVLGNTLNRDGGKASGAFAKTGMEAKTIAIIAGNLVAVGLALVFAARRSHRRHAF